MMQRPTETTKKRQTHLLICRPLEWVQIPGGLAPDVDPAKTGDSPA